MLVEAFAAGELIGVGLRPFSPTIESGVSRGVAGVLGSEKKPQLIAQLGLVTSRKISLIYSGNITVSIRCTTPFFATKSVAITFAPAIETWPSATKTA